MGYLYELAVTPYVFAKKHFGGGSCAGARGAERRVSYGPHRQQRFSYWEPTGDRAEAAAKGKPVVLYFHGGGFVFGESESMADAADVYVARGYRFCSIGFREAPWGKFPAQGDDAFEGAKAAVAWLEARGVDCSRLVVGGTSAGGMLAYLLCYGHELWARHGFEELAGRIVGCVSIAGVSCAADLIVKPFPSYSAWRSVVRVPCAGRSRADMRRAVEPWCPEHVIEGLGAWSAREGRRPVPAFVMHGRADTLAPFSSQVRFVEKLRYEIGADQVTFRTLESWKWQHMFLTVSLHRRDPESFAPLAELFAWLERLSWE